MDTTCTIWTWKTVDSQLIAHDKEVYDIAWGGAGGFRGVSADGSVRVFDLRIRTTARSSTSPRRRTRRCWAGLEQAEPEVHGDDGDGQLQGCGAGYLPALPVAELKKHEPR